MHILRPFTRTLATVAACGLLAAAAQAQTAPKGDGGTIRMLINPAGTMSIPPLVIKKYNLDKKYNINVETTAYTSNNSATVALQGKSTEVVILDWLATARLRAGGIGVIGVAPFLTYVNSVVVPASSTVKDLPDLAGKKLGVHNKTGFDWIIMQAAAKKTYNIDLGKVVPIQEGAVPLLRGLMERNELEATQMWNSLAPEMLASGKFRTMLTIRDLSDKMGLPTVPFLFFGMREEYAKEHPANVRAFVAAYKDAADIMMTDDALWAEQGAKMKLSPQATTFFRDQVRRDLLKTFKPDMPKGLDDTFQALMDVAGPEVLGMQKMPAGLITLDYQ